MSAAVQFGQRVTFTWHLTRRYQSDPSRGHVGVKKWLTEQWPGQAEPEPREGVVIGERTLTNGENHYNGWDEPITYRPKESFKAYLVAFDMRRRPVLVLPEHVAIRPVQTDGTP